MADEVDKVEVPGNGGCGGEAFEENLAHYRKKVNKEEYARAKFALRKLKII